MSALRAMERHLDALYVSDARGRLLRAREPSRLPAPRFHLARTLLGALWRLRADLPADVAIRLARLAGKEAPLGADSAPPEREEFLQRVLGESEPVTAQWAGPAFGFPDTARRLADCGAAVRELSVGDARRAHPDLGLSETDFGRAGCIGAELNGEIVAVCHCARGDGSGPVEAGVVTASSHRRRGFGAAVVQVWAESVRARGGEPLFSTSWDNSASRALAARLGLVMLGEDRHWR